MNENPKPSFVPTPPPPVPGPTPEAQPQPQPAQQRVQPQPVPAANQDMVIPAGAPLGSAPVPAYLQPKQKLGFRRIMRIIYVVIVLALGTWAFISLTIDKNERDELIKTGLTAEGVSTGKVYMYESRLDKDKPPIFKAWYAYTDNEGVKHTVIGDKEYDSADDIKEGMKATVHYYDDSKDDPSTATTNEQ